MKDNQIQQVRVCLEEASEVCLKFEEELIEHFKMKDNPSSRIDHRIISISQPFDENMHSSDDFIIYYLMDDKLIGTVIYRRTEFNNAEVTMITTSSRYTRLAGVQVDTGITLKIPEIKYSKYFAMPWEDHLKVYDIYSSIYGTSQSSERISERGGFGVIEAFELIPGKIMELEVWFSHGHSYPKNDDEWGKIKFFLNDDKSTISYKILKKE